jgi:glutamate-ammonia-ligase adenylyltransferase
MSEIDSVVASFGARGASAETLARFGEAEPERARAAFARALARPELAAAAPHWLADARRSPRPGFAAQCLVDLAEREAAAGLRLDLARAPALARLLGSSTFLARALLARRDLVSELAPERGSAAPPPPAESVSSADPERIREAKYRGLLRIVARDLCGRPFRESLAELSRLADACLAAALAWASRETGVAPPALLALGKLGGRELNLSSDVDLLFVYDAPRDVHADFERNRAVSELARALRAGLEGRGALGFAYRVDLDLRPEGATGALANSVDAALSYYESFGHEWERQALIRLRHVAGPVAPARALERGLEPFVWRRAISEDALRAVRAMKHRIERERRDAGRDLEADLKEGPGGIRDVEFVAQALQLFVGGREPRVRTGNVLDALEALAAARALPQETAAELADAYLWLRRAEHALQLDEERQTHAFPREARAQRALARRMGYLDDDAEVARARLLDDATAVRTSVRARFEELLPGDGD